MSRPKPVTWTDLEVVDLSSAAEEIAKGRAPQEPWLEAMVQFMMATLARRSRSRTATSVSRRRTRARHALQKLARSINRRADGTSTRARLVVLPGGRT